ncbi:nucleoside hydrolase, partial [Staphylococcus epidermidis]|uniref:nucleoside hydrolase n=1 Tax=Staphylococcus epidermidis TaxID=1282 RepID=UPI001642E062
PLSHPQFHLKIISTVNGNLPIHKTTPNPLNLKTFFDTSLPLHTRPSQPFINHIFQPTSIHPHSPIHPYHFPQINQHHLTSIHALQAIRNLLLNTQQPLTFIPIPPLTNITILLTTYPQVQPFINQ